MLLAGLENVLSGDRREVNSADNASPELVRLIAHLEIDDGVGEERIRLSDRFEDLALGFDRYYVAASRTLRVARALSPDDDVLP